MSRANPKKKPKKKPKKSAASKREKAMQGQHKVRPMTAAERSKFERDLREGAAKLAAMRATNPSRHEAHLWDVRMKWPAGSIVATVSAPTAAEAKRKAREVALDRRTDAPTERRARDAIDAWLDALVHAERDRNPRRPPGRWFDRCLATVTARKHARDPAAVCNAAWWKMKPAKRASIVRRMERGTPRDRRAAVAIAKAEQKRADKGKAPPRRPNPPLVAVVYRERKPGDRRAHDYEHEFAGELPKLVMRDGRPLKIKGGSYRTRKGWIYG